MSRQPVLLPPVGWRPPALSRAATNDVIIRQIAQCRCDECAAAALLGYPGVPMAGSERGYSGLLLASAISPGPRLLRASSLTRFDHRPPVHEREWDPFLKNTIPAANDPAYIRAVDVDHDRPVTGADVSRMAKVKRIRGREVLHAATLAAKDAGEPRPEPKGKRAWPKRPMRRP